MEDCQARLQPGCRVRLLRSAHAQLDGRAVKANRGELGVVKAWVAAGGGAIVVQLHSGATVSVKKAGGSRATDQVATFFELVELAQPAPKKRRREEPGAVDSRLLLPVGQRVRLLRSAYVVLGDGRPTKALAGDLGTVEKWTPRDAVIVLMDSGARVTVRKGKDDQVPSFFEPSGESAKKPLGAVLAQVPGLGFGRRLLHEVRLRIQRLASRGMDEPHAFFFPLSDHPGSLEALLGVIGEAKRTLDVAIFQFTDRTLLEMLRSKSREKVKVRVISDDERLPALREVLGGGIEVRADRSKLLMHHKFVVVDASLVVNGSLNWTTGAMRNCFENVVVSRSSPLAAAFTQEFNRLWGVFGQSAEVPASACLAPIGSFDACGCAALFFPDREDGNLRLFLDELRSAKRSLDVCVFVITMSDVVAAMKDAHRRGVAVRVISDDRSVRTMGGRAASELRAAGVPMVTDRTPRNMHHKFCVVDRRTVLTGSFNWTRQAEDGNQENVIIFRERAELARQFCAEFESLWAQFKEGRR